MADGSQIARATVVVMGATILSKLLGFGREITLATVFGASSATDAYLVAMVIPAAFFGIIGSTITTVGIPVFSEYLYQPEKRKELQSLIWTSFHLLMITLVIIVLLALPASPWIARLLAPGFSPEQTLITVGLIKILLPMVIIMGLVGWSQGVLNTHQHFTMPALMGIPYNLIMISGIFLAGSFWGIQGLAWATVLATVSQFLIQVPPLYWHKITYKWEINWRHPALTKMFYLAGPVLIGIGANQLNVIVDRILASGLAEGSISALSYAQRVLGIPQGLFAIPLIIVLYPSLTERTTLGDIEGFQRALARGLSVLAFVIFPLTVMLIILRQELVQFLFQRGAFDTLDARMTAFALLFYSPGLIFLVWRDLLNRAFYALQDTVTPMWTGVTAVIINIGLNLVLVRYLSHGGLALASSIAAGVAWFLLFILLHRRIQVPVRDLSCSIIYVIIASILMGFAVWWFDNFGLDALGWISLIDKINLPAAGGMKDFILQGLRLGILILAGSVIYLTCCWLLKVREMKYLFGLIKNKLKR